MNNSSHTNRKEESKTHPLKPCFHKLSAALLPDELFRKEADVKEWIGAEGDGDRNGNIEQLSNHKDPRKQQQTQPPAWMERTFHPKGFSAGSLGKSLPLDALVEMERCIGIPLYMVANVSPLVIPLAVALWLGFGLVWFKHVATFVAVYHGSLYLIWRLCLVPVFLKRYQRGAKLTDDLKVDDPAHSQYMFAERNVTKYCSMSYVWPDSLHRPALTDPKGPNQDRPVIYCLIPHGLAPYGVVGYPYFSKVWNSKLCSWVCAPVLFRIPFLNVYFRAFGYLPARSQHILEALTKKDRNVGIVLDGIDGMFHTNTRVGTEAGAILNRKGICKIALKANVAMVPVYGFGHTGVYDVVVDPFGILKFLSTKLHMSVTPFFGRWGWFLGPPKRDVPITLCLGDPIYPPSRTSNTTITQNDIDEHHVRLLDGFTKIFDTHKTAYYGESVGAKKKLVFVQ